MDILDKGNEQKNNIMYICICGCAHMSDFLVIIVLKIAKSLRL